MHVVHGMQRLCIHMIKDSSFAEAVHSRVCLRQYMCNGLCMHVSISDKTIRLSKGCIAGAVQIWTVPTRLRPLAAGMGTVTSHLFGDVPTPPLTGWVQGKLSCSP